MLNLSDGKSKSVHSNLLISRLERLSERQKVFILSLLDLVTIFGSTWLALSLRTGELVNIDPKFVRFAAFSSLIALPTFFWFGLYRNRLRYSGLSVLQTLVKATVVYTVAIAALIWLGEQWIPKTVAIMQPIFLFLGIAGIRLIIRVMLANSIVNRSSESRHAVALVYGAGDAGRQLVVAVKKITSIKIIGFVDDDKRLHGKSIEGVPIFDVGDLPKLKQLSCVTDVIIAIPSITRRRRKELIESLSKLSVNVTLLPSLEKLIDGQIRINDLTEPDVDDLVGREIVPPDFPMMKKKISGKKIFITGAGGSIGGELCRQLLVFDPAELVLFEHNEFALYQITTEMNANRTSGAFCNCAVTPLLASVQDAQKLKEILSIEKPDIVFHAAAYKHVPLLEENPLEAIKNNVFGTLNLAMAAVESKVNDCVLISTDKAVRPANVMGATKRLSEMIFQALQAETHSATCFSMVRFGNVLASSGSVIPVFKRQIREGGPITVTHPEVTRFFMTIPEASQLVIQACCLARGGDVFILDMGDPIKIVDLARKLIRLSGLVEITENNKNGDIAIEYTGLRPGEKLYEELLIGAKAEATAHQKIYKASEKFTNWVKLRKECDRLRLLVDGNEKRQAISHMLRMIAT